MSESNQLSRPLGTNIPLPGGDIVDTPEPRQTIPGGSPGGGGNGPPRGSSPSGSMSFDESRNVLGAHHGRIKAAYEATTKALRQVDAVRQSLQRLVSKQDIVSMEDIIEEAGKLVGHGIDPAALAGILADAPQEGGGEALAGWVANHAQNIIQTEQQLMLQHSLNRYALGRSAQVGLMAQENARAALPGPEGPPAGNPLLGG